jgi:hypothetical protein
MYLSSVKMCNLCSLFDIRKESSFSLQYRYALLLEKCDTGTRPSEKECVDTSWRQAGAALWSCKKNLVRVGVQKHRQTDIRTTRRHVHLAQSLTQLVLIARNYSADCELFALSTLCTMLDYRNNAHH